MHPTNHDYNHNPDTPTNPWFEQGRQNRAHQTPQEHYSYNGRLDHAESREIRRKASHSAIERRRRERINERIAEMKAMLPSCADKVGLHKLTILEESAEYIMHLKEQIRILKMGLNQSAAGKVPVFTTDSEPFSINRQVECSCNSTGFEPYMNTRIKLEDGNTVAHDQRLKEFSDQSHLINPSFTSNNPQHSYTTRRHTPPVDAAVTVSVQSPSTDHQVFSLPPPPTFGDYLAVSNPMMGSTSTTKVYSTNQYASAYSPTEEIMSLDTILS
ncbi:hypothetical protein MT418_004098 [Batrachochytrium dendrobatidis]